MKGFNTDSGIPPAEEQMMNTYHKNYDVIVVGAGHAVTVGWVERSETQPTVTACGCTQVSAHHFATRDSV